MNDALPLPPDSLREEELRGTFSLPTEGPVVIPVLAEQLLVGREVVESGRLHISRKVHQTAEEISLALAHDEVQVERVPLNQQLPAGAEAPTTRQEGDTLIIPVLREVVVVETRLLLVEELRVTKKRLTTQHTETVTLRREEISVTRDPAA